jgi:hypothetical protein
MIEEGSIAVLLASILRCSRGCSLGRALVSRRAAPAALGCQTRKPRRRCAAWFPKPVNARRRRQTARHGYFGRRRWDRMCPHGMKFATLHSLIQTLAAGAVVVSLVFASLGCGRTGLPVQPPRRSDGGDAADGGAQLACLTCTALGAECGSVNNGCGVSLTCGTCVAPEVCGGAGVANRCACPPKTCDAVGAECGEILDGCNGIRSCGACPPGKICGGAGPNRCGDKPCRPATCGSLTSDCGLSQDGCSGVLNCGGCGGFDSCGGAGVAHRCGCTKATCAELGANCGAIADGCGGTLNCGACKGSETCGGRGVANACGCTPLTCSALGAHCGSIPDGCGGILACGSCPARRRRSSVCLGIGPADCSEEGESCAPATCARYGARCGMEPDGCGGLLDCGTCKAPETCGGGGVQHQCGCSATTCDALGATCGTVSDGCAGTLDCGSCPLGQTCDLASMRCSATPQPGLLR